LRRSNYVCVPTIQPSIINHQPLWSLQKDKSLHIYKKLKKLSQTLIRNSQNQKKSTYSLEPFLHLTWHITSNFQDTSMRYHAMVLIHSAGRCAVSSYTWVVNNYTWAMSGNMWIKDSNLVNVHGFMLYLLNLLLIQHQLFNNKVPICWIHEYKGGILPWLRPKTITPLLDILKHAIEYNIWNVSHIL
jgi:hypothetical protein